MSMKRTIDTDSDDNDCEMVPVQTGLEIQAMAYPPCKRICINSAPMERTIERNETGFAGMAYPPATGFAGMAYPPATGFAGMDLPLSVTGLEIQAIPRMEESDENDSLVVDVLRNFEFWKHFTFKLSPRKTNVRIAVPYSDGRHGLGEIGIVSEWSDYTVYRGSGCSYTFMLRDDDDPCQIVVKQKSMQLTDWLLKHSNLIKINQKVIQTINNAGN